MRFEFATATRILFGPGTLGEVAAVVQGMGTRALVVIGRTAERARPLLAVLDEQKLTYVLFSVPGEPTTEMVCRGSELAQREGCEVVIGLGGGSVLDAGKAIAILVTNGCDPYEYLEVIGKGKPFTKPPLPYIAIPTTAGTGAEVTRNAVITSPEHRVKVSLRSPLMLPRLALVDPELTLELPPSVTATTGLDALTQLIEPFVSKRANPLTDALCREGISRVARSLLRAYHNGRDVMAREDMALASLFSGLALANAGLGAVHGFAGVMGGTLGAPHGAICARLLPEVMAVNVAALRARAPDSEVLSRYDEIGRLLTGRASARAEEGISAVRELTHALNIPSLSTFGLKEEHFPHLLEMAPRASSMQGNPIVLTQAELEEILSRAL